tara:strand:- start:1430 stop:1918 length:489 start_codon:yes stop_codon:yes gene_type:complete
MKIEFGSGANVPKGFVGCDIRDEPGVKFVCPAWEIVDHVPKQSVDRVRSRHMLEHLTQYDSKRTLRAWHTILKSDGVGTVIVPDMLFHIKQWTTQRDNPKAFKWAFAGFWGWQRETGIGEVWDVHKSGYDEKLLTLWLHEAGFSKVSRNKTEPQHLSLDFHI